MSVQLTPVENKKRKRLSRARDLLQDSLTQNCGLFEGIESVQLQDLDSSCGAER